MMKVALTGGIGSGKSSAAALFRELGVPTIDMDTLSRELTAPGKPALSEIARQFGADILRADGSLDRDRLRSLVFEDPERRCRLESMLHPLIRAAADEWHEKLSRSGNPPPAAIQEIPLLFEAGLEKNFDRIILVTADEALRAERVRRSRQLASEEIASIMAAQLPDNVKSSRSDYVIENNGSPEELRERVAEVWKSLKSEG